MRESKYTSFHYGFYAAMKVEYDLMKAPVTYEQEKELGEEPVRLDFLIIKKEADVELTDPIGKFFRHVNLFEYKSPEDGLSIDDFYKAQGYGLIYKSFDRKVNELPIKEMTLTLVRHTYPRELIRTLREESFAINEVHPGIYSVEGKISIPVQIVVSSRLPAGEYGGLKLLSKGITRENIIDYVDKVISSGDDKIKENAGAVIRICFSANEKLNEQMREERNMKDNFTEFCRYLFKDELDKVNERVARDMLKKNLPLSLIEEISKLSESVIRGIAENIGVEVVLG